MLVCPHDVRNGRDHSVLSPSHVSNGRRFRPGGAGELYAYFPQLDSNANALAKVTKTFANDVYGTSVGRGTFTWKRGACM